MSKFFVDPLYLYLFVAAVFVAMRIPYIGATIRIFNTLIHELSHALVAFFTSGKILKIELQSNTSGSMLSVSKNKVGMFLVAIAGYPLAAACSFLFLWALNNEFSLYVLYTLAVITFVVLILFVRNSFGIIWSVLFIGLLSALIWKNNIEIINFSVFAMAIVLALEAIYSSLALLLISVEDPEKAGDAKLLSSFTMLPTVLWALFFVVLNGWIVYQVVVVYLINS